MKRIISLIIVCIFLFVCSSCDNASEADLFTSDIYLDETEENGLNLSSNDQNTGYSIMPAQPIRFYNMNDVIDFILKDDCSEYNNAFIPSYENMLAQFNKDGYLIVAHSSVADIITDNIALYPETKYEDIGIHYFFSYEEFDFQLLVYNVKELNLTSLIGENETIMDYRSNRFGFVSTATKVVQDSTRNIKSFYIFPITNSERICASFFLDEGIY